MNLPERLNHATQLAVLADDGRISVPGRGFVWDPDLTSSERALIRQAARNLVDQARDAISRHDERCAEQLLGAPLTDLFGAVVSDGPGRMFSGPAADSIQIVFSGDRWLVINARGTVLASAASAIAAAELASGLRRR